MKWLEVKVPVRREDIDAVSEIFDGLKTGGVVIEDPALIYNIVSSGNRESIAPGLSADPGAPPAVKGYLPADGDGLEKLAVLRRRLERLSSEYPECLVISEVDDSSWLNRWREYYRPVRVGERLLVAPSWEPVEGEEGRLVIRMDPGQAFGCGTHPTTTMCMRLLEECIKGGEFVLDVGTGSGILAVTAALLGASGVVALDVDPLAVKVAGENVRENNLGDRIEVRQGNLLDGIDLRVDIVVANIISDVIKILLPQAVRALKGGGSFIASGIIADRRAEMEQAIVNSGLEIVRTLEEGEWVAFFAKAHFK
ncbi:MAG: 50S ribosomal protein L11 methyltransferase [Bacillota bacterium]